MRAGEVAQEVETNYRAGAKGDKILDSTVQKKRVYMKRERYSVNSISKCATKSHRIENKSSITYLPAPGSAQGASSRVLAEPLPRTSANESAAR